MSDLNESCTSLYIGDLHFKVTENILFQKFKYYGNILSVRICRDSLTKMSLGYGYVNFEKRYEAKNAMNDLNLSAIHGQPCRIMWYEKDPSKRNSGVGNIIIKNLDKNISVKDIKDAFEKFGKITSCKLRPSQSRLSKGCAFVNFKREQDSESAIEAMNQTVFGCNTITVEKYWTKDSSSKCNSTNCYIDNCPTNFDDVLLRMIFEKYGVVITAKIMLNEDGVSKGFGFVDFKESKDASKAIKELNGKIIQNQRITVYRVTQKKEASNGNIQISNLPATFDDAKLKQEFQIFGKISSARVIVNPLNANSPRYGIVSFADQDDANDAVREMNNKIVDGTPLSVTFNTTRKQDVRPCTFAPESQMRPLLNFPNVGQPLMAPWPMQLYPGNFPMVRQMNNFIRLPFGGMNPNMVNLSPYVDTDAINRARQLLGENLFPIVSKYAGDRANQITGRLLDLDKNELLGIIGNEALIKLRVLKIYEDIDRETKSYINNDTDLGETLNAENVIEDVDNEESESFTEEESDSDNDSSSNDEESIAFKKSLALKLTPLIDEIDGKIATSVIDWIMNQGRAELLYMVENKDYLRMKIKEAKANSMDNDGYPRNVEKTTLDVTDIDSIEAKQLLGEKLYSVVSKYAGDLAGKVTGILLNTESADLLSLVNNEDSLRLKVEEAISSIHSGFDDNPVGDNLGPRGSVKQTSDDDANQALTNNDEFVKNMDRVNLTDSINIDTQSPHPWSGWSNVDHQTLQNKMISNASLYNPPMQIGRPYLNFPPFLQMPWLPPEINTNRKDAALVPQTSNDTVSKQLLGEKIYPLVSKHAGNFAGKITGMILDLETVEILNILENEGRLKSLIDEALDLLIASNKEEDGVPVDGTKNEIEGDLIVASESTNG